uniref:(northern house mosquito) hypothetical protein n=1 Tax=Culex pipiens TaxID=7175 RepID=A0A8D8PBB8_CULPI
MHVWQLRPHGLPRVPADHHNQAEHFRERHRRRFVDSCRTPAGQILPGHRAGLSILPAPLPLHDRAGQAQVGGTVGPGPPDGRHLLRAGRHPEHRPDAEGDGTVRARNGVPGGGDQPARPGRPHPEGRAELDARHERAGADDVVLAVVQQSPLRQDDPGRNDADAVEGETQHRVLQQAVCAEA